MADKENVRLTRAAARKRPASEALPSTADPSPAKKRVVLGDISSNTLRNLSESIRSATQKKPTRCRTTKRATDAVNASTEAAVTTTGTTASGAEDKQETHVVSIDPQLCPDYATDIYEYLRVMEKEAKRRPLPNYIEKIHKDISATMRGVLVDWLVEVAEEYKLLPETLYLSISHIDRYLSLNPISRHKLQLLGVSCMLIASKYEEITPPQVHEFYYITDNSYTKAEIVQMEADVLKSLKFEMGNPTTRTFLRQLMEAAGKKLQADHSLRLEFLCYYLSELSLLDYCCVKFQPSLIAAAVIFLARFTLNPHKHPWAAILWNQSGYRASELRECVLAIHDLQLSRKGGSLVAIRDKYKQHKFKCVSTLLSPPEIPTGYFDDMETE
ncbi:Belongs to the cyclin [Dionaea muscipula]